MLLLRASSVTVGSFQINPHLVGLLCVSILLFSQISVIPSSYFKDPAIITSCQRRQSRVGRGISLESGHCIISCRAKRLINPSSIFNYPSVLIKRCKPSCTGDVLAEGLMMAHMCGAEVALLVPILNDEPEALWAWNGGGGCVCGNSRGHLWFGPVKGMVLFKPLPRGGFHWRKTRLKKRTKLSQLERLKSGVHLLIRFLKCPITCSEDLYLQYRHWQLCNV